MSLKAAGSPISVLLRPRKTIFIDVYQLNTLTDSHRRLCAAKHSSNSALTFLPVTMNYAHNPYTFEGYAPVPPEQFVDFGVPVSHAQFGPPVYSHPIPYHPGEFHEVYFHPIEDYEDYTEHLTRPRLTKEQVDILETQFQAQPKPNSDVKRQLAIQTNLTLPRVANWFQNRRAKAKQQKRQAEFERMQALAKKGEQSKSKSPSVSDQQGSKEQKQNAGDTDSSVTPTQDRPDTSKKLDSPKRPSSSSKGRGGKASAEHGKGVKTPQPPTDTSRTTVPGSMPSLGDAKNSISSVHPVSQPHESQLSGMQLHGAAPAIWTTLEAPGVVEPRGPTGSELGCSSAEPWLSEQSGNGQTLPNELFSHNHSGAHMSASLPTHLSYEQQMLSPPFSAMHSHVFAEQRRGSSSSEQAEISGSMANDPAQSPGSEKSSGSVMSPFSRCRERRVDLAARRKRPRPAAIGTGLGRSFLGPSSMSPTTRLPNNASHGLRHVKSTQNLGSNLSHRYPGVRKMSAALRSPLGFTNPLESNINMTSTDLTVPPLVTTTMAPPTPLTPEHLQYLLPPTPNDPQFCISPSQDMSSSGWYSTSQSLPLYIHSPPTTPLHPAFAPQLQYQAHPPMSAAPHQTTFDHAPISEQPESVAENTWTGDHCVQEAMKMPQPVHVSPVPFDSAVMDISEHGPDVISAQQLSSSPHAPCHNPHTPPAVMFPGDMGSPGSKPTEFLIQEFPEQQVAHRLSTQHLSSQGPRNYTFNNQTPGSF